MTQLNPQNFFAEGVGGGGSGAPGAKLKDLNDFVFGEIVDQSMAPATDFSTKQQKVDRNGNPIEQLVVVLQTEFRNWQGVNKIPLVDRDNPNSGPKPPHEDDGRRAVFIEPFTNIAAAVGAAITEATGDPQGFLLNGGKLGVQIFNLKDTGKGNPLKEHRAKYEAPAQTAAPVDFFGGGQQVQPQSAPPAQQPVQQVAPEGPPSVAVQQAVAAQQAQPVPAQGFNPPAAVSQNPWENQAAAQAQPAQTAPPAQATQDPWGTPVTGQPPF